MGAWRYKRPGWNADTLSVVNGDEMSVKGQECVLLATVLLMSLSWIACIVGCIVSLVRGLRGMVA